MSCDICLNEIDELGISRKLTKSSLSIRYDADTFEVSKTFTDICSVCAEKIDLKIQQVQGE